MSAMAQLKSTAKVELKGVKKRFGPKVVLDGIDLTIEKGQSLVVIGGSGTGKSVMIKCVLGILRPEAGNIYVDGQEVTRLSGRARDLMLRKFGMLFQGSALFDSLPVWENVAFGLIQGRGMGRKQAREVAIEKLAKVGLAADVGNLSPSELSGGMQKRVGLARAIAADPEIIFFDEPTTGLDPIMSDVIDELICQTQRTKKTTGVVVTHDMKTVHKVADRVVMLFPLARLEPHEPQILYDGPAADLENCADPRVGQFVRGEARERLREMALLRSASSAGSHAKATALASTSKRG
jgi:phospholipid/cholesterol/gamma-HCH transport system ATP-binding protein